MNPRTPQTLSVAIGLALATTLQAQTTAPGPAEQKNDVVTLSPFEVTTSADDGYKATNALSGTRFNTNLLDLPKAVEVITSEFIADIGATEMYDALRYAGGVEVNSAPGQDDITGSNFAVRGISVQTT